jgi:UDP-N-acetylglucosamine diphosphorylase / glucose-1-phosphate thymidylyltransferase / UDP-N-acetylgalactosamine diphosphorylase / glucosamine-1-phosphate N-acetyltransferase / galactosamine-1-phosphate N-acetyltransferase
MDDLSPQSLLDIENYAHAALFDRIVYVWEALEKIESYLQHQKLGKIETDIPASVYLINPSLISIGKGTHIEPGVCIHGPCIIGSHCEIRHGAYLRGQVIIGNGCVIGHDSEIKNSIFLEKARASHFNYVGDSIVGNEANLGAGMKTANLRFNHLPISVTFQGKKIPTNLKKFGVIVGDGAQLGCNCVTNPGTILGKRSFCYPCLNISGCVPENAKVKPPHQNLVEE